LFAATGDGACVNLYVCPEQDSDDAGVFGKSVASLQDTSQSTRREHNEKTNGAYGTSLTFNPTGQYIALGTDKGLVTLFDVETKAVLATMQNHSDMIRALEFIKTEELLVGSDQCSVTLYDLREPHFRASQASNGSTTSSVDMCYVDTLKGHGSWITAVKVASDSNYVASSSVDGQVKVWDMRSDGRRTNVFHTKEEMPVWSLCWKPGAGASTFVTGSGIVRKNPTSLSSEAEGKVRWYKISGAAS
jgi:WD40 repeat protein